MEDVICRFEHDRAVRLYALHLLTEGYDVQARVEGWFQTPDYLYGYRPDIVARKGEEWLVVEIKKSDADWPKISALERVQYEREHFQFVVTSPESVFNGQWVGVDARH
jgi:hypothetical protein